MRHFLYKNGYDYILDNDNNITVRDVKTNKEATFSAEKLVEVYDQHMNKTFGHMIYCSKVLKDKKVYIAQTYKNDDLIQFSLQPTENSEVKGASWFVINNMVPNYFNPFDAKWKDDEDIKITEFKMENKDRGKRYKYKFEISKDNQSFVNIIRKDYLDGLETTKKIPISLIVAAENDRVKANISHVLNNAYTSHIENNNVLVLNHMNDGKAISNYIYLQLVRLISNLK